MEFIIGESIRAHPLALLHPEQVAIADVRSHDRAAHRGYDDGERVLRRAPLGGDRHHRGGVLAKPVVVRMSDFKTNEYAALLGGADFEPAEANPMIGFRGASR